MKVTYEMATHNLMCYSKNYLMTEPKDGFVEEFNEARKIVKVLEMENDRELSYHEMPEANRVYRFKFSIELDVMANEWSQAISDAAEQLRNRVERSAIDYLSESDPEIIVPSGIMTFVVDEMVRNHDAGLNEYDSQEKIKIKLVDMGLGKYVDYNIYQVLDNNAYKLFDKILIARDIAEGN